MAPSTMLAAEAALEVIFRVARKVATAEKGRRQHYVSSNPHEYLKH